jgi:hypothetical protein
MKVAYEAPTLTLYVIEQNDCVFASGDISAPDPFDSPYGESF